MADTLFATLLETIGDKSERNRLELPEDWKQGRAGYDGLVVALALRSMRPSVPFGTSDLCGR
ncbi:MAG: hypothetical protein WBY88_01225 [Desulfosarcina sp.]